MEQSPTAHRAKHSSRPCKPHALGRRFRITVSTLALSALIGLGAGAAPSQATVGSVYTDSSANVAVGENLFGGISDPGFGNVGVARNVMPVIDHASSNTGVGFDSLLALTSGNGNSALGGEALRQNTTGFGNVALGVQALRFTTTANNNTATGYHALYANTGGDNIALGFGAGENLTTGSNNIDIGNAGQAGEQKVIRIGTKGDQTRTVIAGISGRTVNGTAQPVVVNAQGQLGTASAAKASGAEPLSAADARQLVDTVERQQDALKSQQRQIERLRRLVKGG